MNFQYSRQFGFGACPNGLEDSLETSFKGFRSIHGELRKPKSECMLCIPR